MPIPTVHREPPAPASGEQEREAARRIAAAAAEHARDASRRAVARVRARRSAALRLRELPSPHVGAKGADVRGWSVNTYDGEVVGSIGSIYVDAYTKAVRYLGVVLHDAGDPAEVLVPIAATRPQEYRRAMVLPGTSSAEIAAMPRVARGGVTHADEAAALAAFGLASLSDRTGSGSLELRYALRSQRPRSGRSPSA